MTWRNERNLYHRKCNLTGKQIIAMYAPENPQVVYNRSDWWSDAWDSKDYGKDFDFNRPFFEQFHELFNIVPRQNLFGKNTQNCEYTNHCDGIKDCYMTVCTARGERVFFSKWMIGCNDCTDCYQMLNSERCYECLYSDYNYNCRYLLSCDSCQDSSFLFDCNSCSNCFLCWNLRNKQYCIQNVQYSKEEYEANMQEIDMGSYVHMQQCKQQFSTLIKEKAVHQAMRIDQCEDCVGNYIYRSKNVRSSFDVMESQDAAYCYDASHLRDCMDVYEPAFDCELQYESYACNRGKQLVGCSVCYDVDSLLYCDSCHNSHHLFGCIGIRNGSYCILNKQYSKEEYEDLVPRIIEHMRNTPLPLTPSRREGGLPPPSGEGWGGGSEWGQFFPIAYSPFAYNESVAFDYNPLTQQDVEQRGWRWKTSDASENYLGPRTELPDRTQDVNDDICSTVLHCEHSGEPYRIIQQELEFYRQQNIPLPRCSPKQRYRDRLAMLNPRRLWQRHCSNCHTQVESTFAPDRPEKVYCEECYLKEVY